MSWKTPQENSQEARFKAPGPRQKLSDDQVAEIRRLRPLHSRNELSAMFGVRTETIDRIVSGKARTGKPRFPNHRLPPAVRAQAVIRAKQMRDAGATFQAIADEIGVSRLSARNYVEEAINGPSAAEEK